MRKLRPRRGKWLARAHSEKSRQSWDWNPCLSDSQSSSGSTVLWPPLALAWILHSHTPAPQTRTLSASSYPLLTFCPGYSQLKSTTISGSLRTVQVTLKFSPRRADVAEAWMVGLGDEDGSAMEKTGGKWGQTCWTDLMIEWNGRSG